MHPGQPACGRDVTTREDMTGSDDKPSSGSRVAPAPRAASAHKHTVGALDSLTGFAVRSMHQYLSEKLGDVVQAVDLKPHQFTALSLIVDNPAISQSELARALGIKPSNIVQLIDEMEARMLVRRTNSEGTRRSYALVATDGGRALRDKALSLISRHEDGLLTFLSPLERRTLHQLLSKVYAR
jgi:DNA-binding MarR family transcriptional regulator